MMNSIIFSVIKKSLPSHIKNLKLVIPILLFVLVIIFLSIYGTSSRNILKEHLVFEIKNPSKAFLIWKEYGVHGRILIFVDRYLTIDVIFLKSIETRFSLMDLKTPPLTDDNFLMLAIYNNIVRKIYHIVPDSLWLKIKEEFIKNKAFKFDGKSLRVTIEGVPLIILKALDFKLLKEKALIFINEESVSDYDASFLNNLLYNEQLSDIVVIKRI